jgi:hypothetical protein
VFDSLLKSIGSGCTKSAVLLVIAFVFSLALFLNSGPEYPSASLALVGTTIGAIASLAIWKRSLQLFTLSFAILRRSPA